MYLLEKECVFNHRVFYCGWVPPMGIKYSLTRAEPKGVHG